MGFSLKYCNLQRIRILNGRKALELAVFKPNFTKSGRPHLFVHTPIRLNYDHILYSY